MRSDSDSPPTRQVHFRAHPKKTDVKSYARSTRSSVHHIANSVRHSRDSSPVTVSPSTESGSIARGRSASPISRGNGRRCDCLSPSPERSLEDARAFRTASSIVAAWRSVGLASSQRRAVGAAITASRRITSLFETTQHWRRATQIANKLHAHRQPAERKLAASVIAKWRRVHPRQKAKDLVRRAHIRLTRRVVFTAWWRRVRNIVKTQRLMLRGLTRTRRSIVKRNLEAWRDTSGSCRWQRRVVANRRAAADMQLARTVFGHWGFRTWCALARENAATRTSTWLRCGKSMWATSAWRNWSLALGEFHAAGRWLELYRRAAKRACRNQVCVQGAIGQWKRITRRQRRSRPRRIDTVQRIAYSRTAASNGSLLHVDAPRPYGSPQVLGSFRRQPTEAIMTRMFQGGNSRDMSTIQAAAMRANSRIRLDRLSTEYHPSFWESQKPVEHWDGCGDGKANEDSQLPGHGARGHRDVMDQVPVVDMMDADHQSDGAEPGSGPSGGLPEAASAIVADNRTRKDDLELVQDHSGARLDNLDDHDPSHVHGFHSNLLGNIVIPRAIASPEPSCPTTDSDSMDVTMEGPGPRHMRHTSAVSKSSDVGDTRMSMSELHRDVRVDNNLKAAPPAAEHTRSRHADSAEATIRAFDETMMMSRTQSDIDAIESSRVLAAQSEEAFSYASATWDHAVSAASDHALGFNVATSPLKRGEFKQGTQHVPAPWAGKSAYFGSPGPAALYGSAMNDTGLRMRCHRWWAGGDRNVMPDVAQAKALLNSWRALRAVEWWMASTKAAAACRTGMRMLSQRRKLTLCTNTFVAWARLCDASFAIWQRALSMEMRRCFVLRRAAFQSWSLRKIKAVGLRRKVMRWNCAKVRFFFQSWTQWAACSLSRRRRLSVAMKAVTTLRGRHVVTHWRSRVRVQIYDRAFMQARHSVLVRRRWRRVWIAWSHYVELSLDTKAITVAADHQTLVAAVRHWRNRHDTSVTMKRTAVTALMRFTALCLTLWRQRVVMCCAERKLQSTHASQRLRLRFASWGVWVVYRRQRRARRGNASLLFKQVWRRIALHRWATICARMILLRRHAMVVSQRHTALVRVHTMALKQTGFVEWRRRAAAVAARCKESDRRFVHRRRRFAQWCIVEWRWLVERGRRVKQRSTSRANVLGCRVTRAWSVLTRDNIRRRHWQRVLVGLWRRRALLSITGRNAFDDWAGATLGHRTQRTLPIMRRTRFARQYGACVWALVKWRRHMNEDDALSAALPVVTERLANKRLQRAFAAWRGRTWAFAFVRDVRCGAVGTTASTMSRHSRGGILLRTLVCWRTEAVHRCQVRIFIKKSRFSRWLQYTMLQKRIRTFIQRWQRFHTIRRIGGGFMYWRTRVRGKRLEGARAATAWRFTVWVGLRRTMWKALVAWRGLVTIRRATVALVDVNVDRCSDGRQAALADMFRMLHSALGSCVLQLPPLVAMVGRQRRSELLLKTNVLGCWLILTRRKRWAVEAGDRALQRVIVVRARHAVQQWQSWSRKRQSTRIKSVSCTSESRLSGHYPSGYSRDGIGGTCDNIQRQVSAPPQAQHEQSPPTQTQRHQPSSSSFLSTMLQSHNVSASQASITLAPQKFAIPSSSHTDMPVVDHRDGPRRSSSPSSLSQTSQHDPERYEQPRNPSPSPSPSPPAPAPTIPPPTKSSGLSFMPSFMQATPAASRNISAYSPPTITSLESQAPTATPAQAPTLPRVSSPGRGPSPAPSSSSRSPESRSDQPQSLSSRLYAPRHAAVPSTGFVSSFPVTLTRNGAHHHHPSDSDHSCTTSSNAMRSLNGNNVPPVSMAPVNRKDTLHETGVPSPFAKQITSAAASLKPIDSSYDSPRAASSTSSGSMSSLFSSSHIARVSSALGR